MLMNDRYEAKVSSGGRLTVPREVRRALGVRPGDKVAFEITESGIVVQPVRMRSVFHEFAGRSREGEGMAIEEINAWIRDMRGRIEPDL
jgi:AbrB family looped-hinge helix DNA binding protein